MWQSVDAVSTHPALIIEVDERQLDLSQGVYAVRERPQCVRLDKTALTVKDAPSIALVRQLLLDSRLVDTLTLYRVSAVRANTVTFGTYADNAVDWIAVALVLHLADDFFVTRAQLAHVLGIHATEDGIFG